MGLFMLVDPEYRSHDHTIHLVKRTTLINKLPQDMPPERTEKLVQRTLDGKVASASSSKAASKPSKSKSKSKGPPRVYTDAILTIQPKFADLILKKEKNHEFRKYHLREGVVRLWLYETAPTSALT